MFSWYGSRLKFSIAHFTAIREKLSLLYQSCKILGMIKHLLSACVFILCSFLSFSQKVGLVLSGGGANGYAHVGVATSGAGKTRYSNLYYTTGTPMGSIVALCMLRVTLQMKWSTVNPRGVYERPSGGIQRGSCILYQTPPTRSYHGSVQGFSPQPLSSSLPSNLVSPFALDFNSLEIFAGANAVARENFDSLFVPFRCVAANNSSQIKVFKRGELSAAVRASSTYPFYYKPIMVDGELLYDGGMVNNFPVDIMISDFKPDIIIGSNVYLPISRISTHVTCLPNSGIL